MSEPSVLLPGVVCADGSLYGLGWYLSWDKGDEYAVLDGRFTADELEAIAQHMRKESQ